MKIDVEYGETECGSACTPNGCMGHITDIPETIIIDGFSLCLNGMDDWPFGSQEIHLLVRDESGNYASVPEIVEGHDLQKWKALPYKLRTAAELYNARQIASNFPVIHDEYNCTRVYAHVSAEAPRAMYIYGGYICVTPWYEPTINYCMTGPIGSELWQKINAGMEYAYKLAAEKKAGINHYELQQDALAADEKRL